MRNAAAVSSVLLGLLATAAIPAAIWYADRSPRVELVWAGVAVPVAFVLGLAALATARRGRRQAELTVRRTGKGAARVGRLLAVLGLLFAGTGAISLLVYGILTYRGRT